MSLRFADLMFTPSVKRVQETMGSRGAYERFEQPDTPARDQLGSAEHDFIASRDSFYMATVSATGWPYVQHRGGPVGFLKVLDERTLGFADFRGNRQYVSVGNLLDNDRVSLFLIDYPTRRRLKLLGHARSVDSAREPALLARLRDADYDARIERGIVIAIEGFDWNCPQHITPRFTEAEINQAYAPIVERLRIAEQRLVDSASPTEPMGTGPLQLVVSGIRQLTPRVRAYELRSTTATKLPPAPPGAHLEVPIRIGDSSASRSYSISCYAPHPDRYEIAVLADGKGSRAIHQTYALGTQLRCSAPAQAFALHDDRRPALLIAGGIGITPIKAMAEKLVQAGRAFELHYCARSATDAAYAAELRAIAGQRMTEHFAQSTRLDVPALIAAAATDSIVYVCGPQTLIDDVRAATQRQNWASDRVRFERFTPPKPSANDQAFALSLERSGVRVSVAGNMSALDALENEGIAPPSSCRSGVCGSCKLRCVGGTIDHRDQVLTPAERAAGWFTPCVSRAKSAELAVEL